MVHLLTFLILFCSLSVQWWRGLKIKISTKYGKFSWQNHIILKQEQWKGGKSGKQLITWTRIVPSSFPRRNSVVFRETGVIAGSTKFSSNKTSLRYQSSKTSPFFLKDVMELTHESVTLSSLVRRALNATCWTLICCFPAKVAVSSLQAFSANPRFLHCHVQGILRSQM